MNTKLVNNKSGGYARMKGGLKYLALLTQIGLTMVFSVIIGILVGLWLDRALNTNFIFTLVFIFIGGTGGVVTIYRLIQKISVDDIDKMEK